MGASVTSATALLAATAIALCVVTQDLPLPEKWTIYSILGFVLAAVAWLLRSVGTRLVNSLDLNTATIAKLVAELHSLSQHNVAFRAESDERHAALVREHDKDIADLKETIRDAVRGRGK